MRILADENIPGELIEALRSHSHEVVWVRDISPGIDDQAVLQLAGANQSLLLSQDKDFGHLVFKLGLPAPFGLILLRLRAAVVMRQPARIISAIEMHAEWAFCFGVLDESGLRTVRLPRNS